jgi:glucose-1-phosphate adenylyltransferase
MSMASGEESSPGGGDWPLARHAMAFVLAGGRGSRLMELTDRRTKPAVHFGGKARIIDFTLSNALNSGIRRLAVATQYKAHSLIRHLQRGWTFLRPERNESFDILPASQRVSEANWYLGTADAVYQNIDIIADYRPRYIVLLAGDHIYKMDYERLIAAHQRSGADVTVSVREVSLDDARRMGVVDMDERSRITGFQEKPKRPTSRLASMGIYAFTADALAAWLDEARPDFGADVLPAMLAGGAKVMAHRFRGYWQDVGTLPAYFDANMALLAPKPELDLYERDWLILTRSEERAPARIGADARVEQSMISHGCVIEGIVERSVLSPGVRVGRGAIVRDSIVMFDAVIGPGAVIDHAIIDKEVHIGRDAKVGVGELPGAPNRANPEMLATGLVVIGKQAEVPDGASVGRNVLVDAEASLSDWPDSGSVKAGATIKAGRTWNQRRTVR